MSDTGDLALSPEEDASLDQVVRDFEAGRKGSCGSGPAETQGFAECPACGFKLGQTSEAERHTGVYDWQVERSVLCCAMLDREVAGWVASELEEPDFHRDAHRVIFRAVQELYVRGVMPAWDVVVIYLKDVGKLENAGGVRYMLQVAGWEISGASAEFYLERLKALSRRRALRNWGKDIAEAVEANSDVEDLLGMGNPLEQVRPLDQDLTMLEAYDLWEKRQTGPSRVIPTGLSTLDQIMRKGLHPGELTVLAARPSTGKSSLAGWIAIKAAAKEFSTLYVTREMTAEELMSRWTTAEGGDGDAIARLVALPLRISAARNAVEIRGRAAGRDLIVVDYLNTLQHPYGARLDIRMGHTVDALKALALDFKCHVLLLAQLSREIERRGKRMEPQLSDLRECGKLEEVADNVWFLSRPERNQKHGREDEQVKVFVRKQRNGETAVLDDIYCHFRTMRWRGSWVPPVADEAADSEASQYDHPEDGIPF